MWTRRLIAEDRGRPNGLRVRRDGIVVGPRSRARAGVLLHELDITPDADDARDVLDVEVVRINVKVPVLGTPIQLTERVEQPLARRRALVCFRVSGGFGALLARFPGERVSRPIALETTADTEHLLPGDVRARYRPPTAGDRELLKGLAAKPHGAPGRNVAGRQSR